MKEINKIQLNTEEYIIEPPIANETIQGGILAKQKTNENVPVKIRDGKCFIPGYPNGDNKIDIAQSAQNKDKVMAVNNSGELEATEYKASNDNTLFGHIDKQETYIINDGFGGSFKNLIVNGKTTQKVETDIVPTPQRPIPINSRKTTITKINLNIFDFEKENDTSNIPDSGTYRSIGQHQLKPNTKYVFSWSGATVPAKATLSFQIQNNTGTVLVSPFTYFNISSDEKEETGKDVKFTTDSSGIVKFAYNCTVATSNTTETYQQYWYTKILKDISLKEDVEYEPEYVELRSLKETSNLFDKNIMAFTSGTLKVEGTVDTSVLYAVSGFVPVRPSTQYTIKVIDGFRLSTKVYYDINKQVISNELITTFTTPSNCYFVRWQTATTDTRVLTEEDIQKINDEMMMVKGDSLPSTYVPPTVRDYKIVDHTAKTAKIVRNTFELLLTGTENWKLGNSFGDLPQYFYLSTQYVSDTSNDIKNTHFKVEDPYTLNEDCLGFFVKDVRIRYEKYDGNIEGLKQWLTGNNVRVFGKLQTPTEESIPYLEDDTSEVGYSWQDTTSPSPTIPAEVKGVEKIDILKTEKNLFDINDEDVYLSPNITHNGNQIIKNDGSTFPRIKLKNLVIDKEYTLSYSTKLNKSISNGQLLSAISSKNMGYPDGVILYKVGDGGTDYNVEIKFTATQSEMYLIFSIQPETITNLQIELGDTATSYESYKEQHVNITLLQPLYENDIANVESENYEYYTKNTTIDFNRFTGNVDLIQEHTIRYSFNKKLVQEFDGIILDTLMFDCFRKINDDSDTVHFKIGGANNEYVFMYIPKNYTNDITYAKEYLNSLNLIANFAVETKTEIPIPEDDLSELKSLKTEQGVTNIFSNVPLTFDYEQSVQIVIDNIKKQINSTNANILIGG